MNDCCAYLNGKGGCPQRTVNANTYLNEKFLL